MIFDQVVRAQIDELARGASAIQAWVEQSEAFARRVSAEQSARESLAESLAESSKFSSLAQMLEQSEAFARRVSAEQSARESFAKSLAESSKFSSLAQVLGRSEAFARRVSVEQSAVESLAKSLAESSKFSSLAQVLGRSETFARRVSVEQSAMESLAKSLTAATKVSSLAQMLEQSEAFARRVSAEQSARESLAESLTAAAKVSFAQAAALTTNFGNLTRSYQSLLDTASTHESLFKHVPFITTYAPVEYNREVEVLNSISVEDDDGLVISEVISKSVPSVDAVLANFDDRLCPLLQGARAALRSDNPDRARHVVTSLRELTSEVLRVLAPDDDIREWSTDERHFVKTRPTRRARVLYIHRHINSAPLTSFVEHDVKGALLFLDLLQGGTDRVESSFTEAQLNSIVLRTESLLVFLLQLRNTG